MLIKTNLACKTNLDFYLIISYNNNNNKQRTFKINNKRKRIISNKKKVKYKFLIKIINKLKR